MINELLFAIFTFAFIQHSSACNGVKLSVDQIKHCDKTSLVKINNITAQLDEECFLDLNGCAQVTRSFKTAMANYNVKVPLFTPFTGTKDACKVMTKMKDSNNKLAQVLSTLQLQCPIPKRTICFNSLKKIDISKVKNQLPMMLGKTSVIVNVEHNNGKSCIDVGFTLHK